MFKKSHLLAATLALPSLVACGVLPISPTMASKPAVTQAATFGSSAVVKDTSLGGTRFAFFSVTTANPAYGTQSVVHRYTSSDVAYYVLTLDDLTNSKTDVAQVQVTPGQQGVFTHLLVNTLYKVRVAAYSDVQSDGTTGTTAIQINTNDQWASTEFNFTSGDSGNNNVDNQINYCSTNFYNALTVHLDNSAFDGTAYVSTATGGMTVYAGSYTNPTDAITATAESGSTCSCSTTSSSSSSTTTSSSSTSSSDSSCTDGSGNDKCQGQGSGDH